MPVFFMTNYSASGGYRQPKSGDAALALAVRCNCMEVLAIFAISPYNVTSKTAVEN